MMAQDGHMDSESQKAREHEKKLEWLEAAENYEQTLRPKSAGSSTAKVWERIGFCYTRASTQAETIERFRKLRQLAVKAHRQAAKYFEKEETNWNKGKSLECNAVAEYLESWLASSPSEKKQMLDECLSLGNRSLRIYEKADDQLSYGRMCNVILSCLLERLYVSSNWQEMKRTANEGIDYANKAIATLFKLDNKAELLRAYFNACLQNWYAANIIEQENERKEVIQKSLNYAQKAVELSKRVGDPYLTAMSSWAAASCTLCFTENVESALEYAKEILKQGTIARDNYLKGIASYVLALVTDWMILREADPDKQKEEQNNIIKYAKDAINQLQLVSQDFFVAETYRFYTESHFSLARDVEISLEDRRSMLEKAVELGRKGLEHANRSGSPDAIGSTLHALSKALHFYSGIETRKKEKSRLLEEALVHRNHYNNIVKQAFPSNDWIRGVGENYEGLVRAELARMETDKDARKRLLEIAVLNMESGVSHCRKRMLSHPTASLISATARFEDDLGKGLTELYLLSDNKEILIKAIKANEEAARDFKNANLPSRAAESYWNVARNQDLRGEHQKAAETFEEAFLEYKDAAQKIVNFADFYLNYAVYMKAWSEIERAKFSHEQEKYSVAKKHYENAAELLKSSKLWNYLASNFLAWSLLEHAEDLSRKENSQESIEGFKNAAGLFQQAGEDFKRETDKIQNPDEKEKALELREASLRRKEYCTARVNLEEARIFDLRGDHAQSAEKYDLAAETFEKILDEMRTETEQIEIKPIACMCRAWQKMKMADGRVSPELYGEASELFLKAREYGIKDRTALLASGNSSFCKALQYGTKFEAERERHDFAKAKQCLESAGNYYMKAGLESASKWTSATGMLFDAYNYMIAAELEPEPERKMNDYLLAEKCLEQSSRFFEAAGFVGKKDEVLRILEKVKEKREFAVSLRQLLTTPIDASGVTMIAAPALTIEEPVGLSKFEHAFIQANLIARRNEVQVGETLALEVQLANLGKDLAFLIKMEEFMPKGFDLVESPDRCVVDDGFLNLRGRKLAPLETQEMKLLLKPRRKGEFTFKPKIEFMDEAGHRKACEFEQITVNVRELGIRGWLKGPI